jgi:hypothetical protein
MFIFGFIMAATLGCTAGSVDLTEGMFRHLVVTGRSRVALYFARIPAGLAIITSIVAVGFTIVCVVCCLAAPKTLNYDGVNLPAGMSSSCLQHLRRGQPGLVICNFNYNGKSQTPSTCPVSTTVRRTRARSEVRRTRRASRCRRSSRSERRGRRSRSRTTRPTPRSSSRPRRG